MLQLKQIMEALDQLAPWDLAESWDHVGLQVGHDDQSVSKVMVALDINEQVIQEGLNSQVDGFVLHHPLLFKPMTQIHLNTPTGRCLELLLKHRFFLIAAHTNADKAANGLNQFLADQFGLTETKLLEPCQSSPSQSLYKVAVFSPADYITVLRNAMVSAGAGNIGNYSECSFEIKGSGTFRPGSQAKPFIGEVTKLNRVDEIRLEMVVSEKNLSGVIEAIRTHHPYQEPVIDVYPTRVMVKHGMGRVGRLAEPLPVADFCSVVKQKLSARDIRMTGPSNKMIHTLAICSGSGGSLLPRVLKSEVDAFLTGELNYHDFLLAKESGMAVIAAGHWGTEHCFVDLMVRYFNDYFKTAADFEAIPSTALWEEPYEIL